MTDQDQPAPDEPTGVYVFPMRRVADLLDDEISRRTLLASLRPPTGSLDALSQGISFHAAGMARDLPTRTPPLVQRQGKPDDIRSALGLPPALAFPDYVHPCRVMETRACPVSYDGGCGARPCARFESSDETPWEHELRTGAQPAHKAGCPCIGCAPVVGERQQLADEPPPV